MVSVCSLKDLLSLPHLGDDISLQYVLVDHTDAQQGVETVGDDGVLVDGVCISVVGCGCMGIIGRRAAAAGGAAAVVTLSHSREWSSDGKVGREEKREE